MASLNRIFGISIMALIIIFALIHLAVSIGIIIPFRKYGDIFRPQIALCAFNIVISFFGLLAGILALLTVAANAERFAKIVAVISGLLGILTLGSLVAAIIINSMSLNYISTHILNNLNNYKTSGDARNNIDFLQHNYLCCGVDLWVDWASIGLDATIPITGGTTTVPNTNSTTSATGSTLTQTNPTTMTTTTTGSGKKKRDTNDALNNHQESLLLSDSSRRKRQAALSSYGGIVGLPADFNVTLPLSCCTGETQLTLNNTSSSYCLSVVNGVVNHFYTGGCTKPAGLTAGNQAMGIGVINCFMVVLAFVAIPLLLDSPSASE